MERRDFLFGLTSVGAAGTGGPGKRDAESRRLSHAARAVETMADLKAIAPSSNDIVWLRGYHKPLDGCEGFFCWNRDADEEPDGGTVIRATAEQNGRWRRVTEGEGYFNVRWFGAKGDGGTDDTAAIQATIDSGGEKSTIYLPGGIYRVTAPLTLQARQTFIGVPSDRATTIKADNVKGPILQSNASWRNKSRRNIRIENISIEGRADYGIRLLVSPGSIIKNIRCVANCVYDHIHMGACWDSTIDHTFHWVDNKWRVRSCIWLDSKMHATHVSNIHTAAATKYGIVLTREGEAQGAEIPAQVLFTQLVLQRQEVGLDIRSGRGITAIGIYSEGTVVPVRLGTDTETVNAVTLTGGRLDDAKAHHKKYTPSAAIELINCVGVNINGMKFENVKESAVLLLKKCKKIVLSGCCLPSAYRAEDLKPHIKRHPDADPASGVMILGNGAGPFEGRGILMQASMDPRHPNQHFEMGIDNQGHWVATEWVPGYLPGKL